MRVFFCFSVLLFECLISGCSMLGYGIVYSKAMIECLQENTINTDDMNDILSDEVSNYEELCSICKKQDENISINLIRYNQNIKNILKKLNSEVDTPIPFDDSRIKFISCVQTFSSLHDSIEHKIWAHGPDDLWIILYDNDKNIIGSFNMQKSLLYSSLSYDERELLF